MAAAPWPVRLVALRWRPFRLPLRHRFEAAHGALADRTGVVLELHDASGLVGIGEASPMPSLGDGSAEDVLALLTANASSLLAAPEAALAALQPGPGVAALACGVDTALLDLEGQRRRVPIAKLLADCSLGAVPVNAVVGSGDPQDTVRFAAEAVAAGYTVLKFKVAVAGLATDVARIFAVRRAYPNVHIRLDANGAWTEAQAAEALAALASLDVELIEQPVRPSAVRALGRLHHAALIPVAADEAVGEPAALDAILTTRAARFVVLKPMRLGGLRPSLEIARRAAAAGLPAFVTTTFDSSVGTAAALHLAAALGPGRPADGLSTAEHLAADLVTRPLRPRDGQLRIPARPGLGLQLQPAALDRLATASWAEVRARRR